MTATRHQRRSRQVFQVMQERLRKLLPRCCVSNLSAGTPAQSSFCNCSCTSMSLLPQVAPPVKPASPLQPKLKVGEPSSVSAELSVGSAAAVGIMTGRACR